MLMYWISIKIEMRKIINNIFHLTFCSVNNAEKINIYIFFYTIVCSVLIFLNPLGGDEFWYHFLLIMIEGETWVFPIIHIVWVMFFIQLIGLFYDKTKILDNFFKIFLNFIVLNCILYFFIVIVFLIFYHDKPL